jgi:hypothetical protein
MSDRRRVGKATLGNNMRGNRYLCSHFVKPALERIVTGKVSSVFDRVAIVSKFANGCSIEEDDFPEFVRSDWHTIQTAWAKPISPDYRGIADEWGAWAHSLTRTEAKHVLECFLRIAYAVISRKEE